MSLGEQTPSPLGTPGLDRGGLENHVKGGRGPSLHLTRTFPATIPLEGLSASDKLLPPQQVLDSSQRQNHLGGFLKS